MHYNTTTKTKTYCNVFCVHCAYFREVLDSGGVGQAGRAFLSDILFARDRASLPSGCGSEHVV
eukprot:78037-Amphidinium_carterae.1